MKQERQGSVYVLHNLINDKEYVGQTIRKPEVRWAEHIKAAFVKKDKRPLYRAMCRNGLINFTAEVIWIGPESKLNAAEIRFVRQRKTFKDTGWGYNLTTGGGQFKMSRSTCLKIRRAARAYYRSDIGRKNLSVMKLADWAKVDAKERHALTADEKAWRAESTRRAYQRPSVKHRHSKAVQASYDTDSTRRARLSISLLAAHKADPTFAQRISASSIGKVHTTISKRQLSIEAKAQWASPEGRAKKLDGMIGKKRSAIGRAHMSAAAIGRTWSASQRTAFIKTTAMPAYKACIKAGIARRKLERTPKEQAAIANKVWITRRANAEKKRLEAASKCQVNVRRPVRP